MRIRPTRSAVRPPRGWGFWRRMCGGCEARGCLERCRDLQLVLQSDGIVDFMDMANDYRARIGVDRSPEDGEAYLRALIELAKQTFGAG